MCQDDTAHVLQTTVGQRHSSSAHQNPQAAALQRLPAYTVYQLHQHVWGCIAPALSQPSNPAKSKGSRKEPAQDPVQSAFGKGNSVRGRPVPPSEAQRGLTLQSPVRSAGPKPSSSVGTGNGGFGRGVLQTAPGAEEVLEDSRTMSKAVYRRRLRRNPL